MLVVYFIGRNFPNLYVYILSVLYTIFVIVPTMGFILAMENQYSLIELYLQSYPDSAIAAEEPINTPLVILFVNSLGWAISIVFMFHIRKAKS